MPSVVERRDIVFERWPIARREEGFEIAVGGEKVNSLSDGEGVSRMFREAKQQGVCSIVN